MRNCRTSGEFLEAGWSPEERMRLQTRCSTSVWKNAVKSSIEREKSAETCSVPPLKQFSPRRWNNWNRKRRREVAFLKSKNLNTVPIIQKVHRKMEIWTCGRCRHYKRWELACWSWRIRHGKGINFRKRANYDLGRNLTGQQFVSPSAGEYSTIQK